MLKNDLSHWPLVITVASGPASTEEYEAFFAQWAEWLQQDQRFATLRVFMDEGSLTHPEGSAQQSKLWLQQWGASIREKMMGMATVVPEAQYPKLSKMNAEKLFGVPAQTFADTPASIAWLEQQVFQQHLPKSDTLMQTLTALQTAVRS
ncbi:hypothetical protein ACLPHM_00195 [Paenalcaligenes sp. Me131]|uniref:hypothetical protein n=1 Tax=Paenalcaligenes sp. Me131 TaxID=3392636 RepID=UPI003D2A646A